MSDIFRGCGVEVLLPSPDNFLKVKETLTRIGVASRKEQKLYQSCHILHKQGRYSIVHFKELFILDGREDTLSEDDVERRNTIATLLNEWNLVTFAEDVQLNTAPVSQIKIIPYKDKHNWVLSSKYTIGKIRA